MDVIRSKLGLIALIVFSIVGFRPTPIHRDLAVTIEKAKISAASGLAEEALRYLDDAINLDAEFTSLYINIAAAALATENVDQAEKFIEYLKEYNLQDERTLCLEFDLLSKIGDAEGALEIWKSNDAACQDEINFLKTIAFQLISERDFLLADEALKALSEELPADPEVQFFHGLILATKEPEASLAYLRLSDELMLEKNPIALELVRRIEDARIVESEAYTLAQAGQVLAKYGYWGFAANAFQNALEIEPTYVDAHTFLGLSLDELGGTGFESYQRAIELADNQALPHIYLGMHWMRNGYPEIALEKFEKAKELEPENPIVNVQIGNAYEMLGEIEIAIEAYRIATELSPQDSTFWIVLAQASLNHEFHVATMGQPAARNAVALEPDNALAVDALAYSYYLLGDFDYADRLITKAIDLDPLNPSIQYHLGLLRASQNQYQGTIAAFEMAALLDPDGSIGEMARRALETISQ